MSPAIKLLGTVVLRRSDGVVVDAGAVPTSKALDLLRLLVAADEQERGADHYIGLLWPTADEARGRMSLRTAVAQLRRALGPDVVRRSGDLLTLGDVETRRRPAPSRCRRPSSGTGAWARTSRCSGWSRDLEDVLRCRPGGLEWVVRGRLRAARGAARGCVASVLLDGAEQPRGWLTRARASTSPSGPTTCSAARRRHVR